MAKAKSRPASSTAIVVANAAPKAVVINADKDPNPNDPHSWLPLVGEPAGAQGLRIMHGTLRLEYRHGWRNSAEAMARAKLVPVASSDPLAVTAVRYDVLVPDGVDDIYADPWLLPRVVDRALAREIEGKTPIWCYVTVTDPATRHLHESWKVGRRAADRICDRYAVPVILVQHAPHHASNAAAPHLHYLIGVRRLDERGFSTAVAALTNDKTRDLFAAIWAEVASGG